MIGGFNRWEPINTSKIHLHSLMVDIFRRHHCLGFFELFIGYDDDVAQEFSMALNPQARTYATIVVRGLSITISHEVISRITTFPQGVQWRKKDKARNTFSKNFFFLKI